MKNITQEEFPNKIVCDENIFNHAVFRENPWNEPDDSSLHCIQELSKNKTTLYVNQNIIRHYSNRFNDISRKLRENKQLNSSKMAIYRLITNYYTVCKEYCHFDKNTQDIVKPDEVNIDDEDFFYVAMISKSEMIVNDSGLRKGVLDSKGMAYYSSEFVRKYLPGLIISENIHPSHPEWWVLNLQN